jgi:hypothetical protein
MDVWVHHVIFRPSEKVQTAAFFILCFMIMTVMIGYVMVKKTPREYKGLSALSFLSLLSIGMGFALLAIFLYIKHGVDDAPIEKEVDENEIGTEFTLL